MADTQPVAPPVRSVMVATDRSPSAERAVAFAAEMARRYDADLHLVQVIVPKELHGVATAAESARASYAAEELTRTAQELAGERGHAQVFVDADPAQAIVAAADRAGVDVLVVGNVGMRERKEFLLGNVPNRVSHNARCTVVIVNTSEPPQDEAATGLRRVFRRG